MDLLPRETIQEVCKNICEVETSLRQCKSLRQRFDEQRGVGEFCDVIIQCRGCTYHAHKCVLASVSPYFKTLFLSPLSSGDRKEVINFDHYSTNSVKLLLDFIYAEPRQATVDIAELLQLAEFLQYDSLVDVLVGSIRTTINKENCTIWYKIGKECGIDALTTLIKSYVTSNYDELVEMQEYKNMTMDISELVSTREPVFDKDVVFYHSHTSVYIIDISKKTVEEHKSGPCFLERMQPELSFSNTFDSFCLYSFFIFNRELHVASTYNLCDLNESIYDSSFFEENIKIQISRYNHCSQTYNKVYSIEPCALIGKVYSDRLEHFYDCQDGHFWVTKLTYNNLDHLYILIEDEGSQHIIYKFDLRHGTCACNYIRLKVDSRHLAFVESKQLGTLLVNGVDQVYRIEEFDFNKKRDKQEAKKLKLQQDEMKSRKALKKKTKWYEQPCKVWRVVSLNGEIYLFVVFRNTVSKLNVLYLNTEKHSWLEYCDFSISGGLSNAFCCLGKGYVVLSLKEFEKNCPCTDNICMFDFLGMEANYTHYKIEEMYEHIYEFNPDKKTLTNLDMKLPANGDSYHASIVPAYFVI